MGLRRPTCNAIRLLVATALAGAAFGAACAPVAIAAPSVTIAEPVNGGLTIHATPTFSGTTALPSEAVAVRVYSGKEAVGLPREMRSALPGGDGRWSLELLVPLEDGVYTAQASQSVGEPSEPVTFTIRRAPVVTLEQPRPAPGETAPAFDGTASESTPVTVEIYEGGSTEGRLVSTASAAGSGTGWRSSSASPALAVGHYTAIAVQKSSLAGNPPGVSPAVGFDVTPPPAPPPQQGIASLASAQRTISRAGALMAPFPVVRIVGIAYAGGVRLRLLSVGQAPAGALIRVRCRGHGCPPHGVRRTTVAGPHGVPALVFRSFERFLRAGAVVEVFISKGGEIGKYTRLRVRRGKLPERIDLCLDATGNKPIVCPAL